MSFQILSITLDPLLTGILQVLVGLVVFFKVLPAVSAWYSQRVLNNGTTVKFEARREVVLITGGSSGIGWEMVKGFLALGVAKVIILDVNAPKEVRDSDRQVFYKLDLTSPSATQSVCNKIKAEHGSPTVLINNAGLGTGHDILSETTESLELVFNLNLFAHYRLVQEFLPAMIASNHGHIVNIASMASFSTVVRNVAYSATKAAVLAFSEGLRQELRWVYGGSRIRITSVHPTWIRTPLISQLTAREDWNALTLEPEFVGKAVVRHVVAGKSGQLCLPASYEFLGLMRGFPDWIQEKIRDAGRNAISVKSV